MTALPRRMYRNPEEQLLEAEAESCKGCRFRVVSGKLRDYDLKPEVGCTNPRMRNHGRHSDVRCHEYQENA